MDDLVRAAMKKWPTVPACHGWLALDARGDWYFRDDAAQASGRFPAVKGSRVEHPKLRAFIERNYLADGEGAWYFQNGPQRVFVQLEASPFVWGVQRVGAEFAVHAHTGADAGAVHEAWLDEQGRLFLGCDHGFGLLRSMDMNTAADAVEAGLWRPHPVAFDELPKRYRYQLNPMPG